MKRFYAAVAAAATPDGGWTIALDGRPVRTPARALLTLPSERMAAAVVREWAAQEEEIVPASMPLTGMANAAIDIVSADPAAFAAPLAAYVASDLLCYRAEETALAARQAAAWDPLLEWAHGRHGISLITGSGIMPIVQGAALPTTVASILCRCNPFALAALSPIFSIGGSAVVALALADDAITADAAWDAVTIDERWQAEHWGEDAEATARLAARQAEWADAAQMLALALN